MAGAVRDPVYHDYVWGGIFLIAHSLIGNFLASFAVPFVTLLRPQQVRFIVGTGCMALADCIWQPHQGNP